ncbi:MAG: 16S rRNA (adenine(1518)-N(6)/adenine(1519)-N(6))-dimethyltransferase RsmA [Patescibacteria group bacterium]
MGERLGQHMLVNKTAIPKIIAALDLQPNDTVIEIGPGEGALTFPLLEAAKKVGAKVIAIEKDLHLANQLKSYAGATVDELEIVTGDALKLLHSLTDKLNNWKLIGNIPYYITGQLLRILSESENPPKTSVLMVQEEVADRICSRPPKMNLLSAITQFWAQPELILRLKPEDFDPPPKVKSAVIKLESRKQQVVSSNEIGRYYRLVKLIFKQPRKTAANNLADGLEISKKEAVDLIKSVGLQENSRPQDFSLDQLIKLSTITAK